MRGDHLGSLFGQGGEKRHYSYFGTDYERCMEDLAQRLNQLRDQLAVRRQAIEQQQGEILRYRSLVGPYDTARADLMASLVSEEDDWHPRDCSSVQRKDVCGADCCS